jgi:cytochrome c oxidase cbb3-type subunit III
MSMRASSAAPLLLLALACQREQRPLDEPTSAPPAEVSMSTLQAATPDAETPNPPGYRESAWVISEGKVLFEAYNCVGCHAHGGGDIGPPLMDAGWIYGSAPANVHATIVEGRPNGMPSFRGKIDEPELWKLVAYVRAMGGLVRSDAQSARDDDMHAISSPATRGRVTPRPQEGAPL